MSRKQRRLASHAEPNWCMFGSGRYPWFPSVTVYRRTLGMAGWRPVLGRVAQDLQALIAVDGDGREYRATGQRNPEQDFRQPLSTDTAFPETEVAR